MTRPLLRGVLLASALIPLGGCAGEEMAPYGRLTSLRVLAIQSDPVAPMPGETTTLTPLLYVPRGQSEPELSWSWCPFPGPEKDGYPCQFSADDLQAIEDQAREAGFPLELPPFDPELGTGPTMQFVNAFPPEFLQGLCSSPLPGAELGEPPAGGEGGAAAEAEPATSPEQQALARCPHGFPIQIKLKVKTDKDEVTAVRTLHLAFDALHAGNTLPVLPEPALELQVEGEWTAVTGDFTGPVLRDEKNELRALVTEEQAQDFDTVDEGGQTRSQKERLNIAWFVESGNTKSGRTGFIEGVAPLRVLNENEWYPDPVEDYRRTKAELVMVLRDDREGVSWWRHTFDVAEAP